MIAYAVTFIKCSRGWSRCSHGNSGPLNSVCVASAMPPPDLYISIDVEADGPIPGPYSILSFGLAVAGSFDGTKFTESDPTAETFYRELAPISEQYDPDALAVSGLDRDLLVQAGADPGRAMTEAASWIGKASAQGRAV